MFTALLPSYNHKKYLTECVLSAIQSKLVTEVLIVDDGSSDGTIDLFDRIKRLSPKIQIIENNDGNYGAHRRLNQLALAASNNWIAVLNTDDLFVPGRFEAIARIAANSKAEMFFGDLVLIDGEGDRIGFRNSFRDNEYTWPDDINVSTLSSQGDWLPMLAIQNIAATTTNMIFTKNLYHSVGGFKNYRYCHDWDFIIRASTVKGRVSYVPTMISKYRIHASNTIKEDKTRVIYDVRRMFYNIKMDMPELFSDLVARGLVTRNKYLASFGESFIAIVSDDQEAVSHLNSLVLHRGLPIEIYMNATNLPDHIKYKSIIPKDQAISLCVEDLLAIALSLSFNQYDRLTVNIPDKNRITNRSFNLSFNIVEKLATKFNTTGTMNLRGVGNHTHAENTNSASIADLNAQKQSYAKFNLFLPKSPILDNDDRPLVFIFPAFLAVGGVERLILDTVTLLEKSYRFVIINTERLRLEQGSMHAEFSGIPIFDITEIVQQQDFIRTIEYLKNFYEPDLVWICNGAPWQVAHAKQIREIFNNIPIVDHMAYDHNEGWINSYNNEGVLASDRFVAINKKIMNSMISKYSIDPQLVELVYHGTNLQRFKGRMSDKEVQINRKEDLNLDPCRLVFGMVGRLTPQKRPLDMIELAKYFEKDEFVWVGLGELESAFASEAEKLSNIRLIPAQRDLIPIYQMIDGLIVLSEFEGLPLVVLEALAMGVPILSTDVGAIGEVLSKYQSGLVFAPPGNIPKLKDAFIKFKDELTVLREFSLANAQRAADDFSSENMAANYARIFKKSIYEKTLSRKNEYISFIGKI